LKATIAQQVDAGRGWVQGWVFGGQHWVSTLVASPESPWCPKCQKRRQAYQGPGVFYFFFFLLLFLSFFLKKLLLGLFRIIKRRAGPGHPRCHLLCGTAGPAGPSPRAPRAREGTPPPPPWARPAFVRPSRPRPRTPGRPRAGRLTPTTASPAGTKRDGRAEQAAPEAWASSPGRVRSRELRRGGDTAAAAGPALGRGRQAGFPADSPEAARAARSGAAARAPRPRRRTPRPSSGRAPLGRWLPSSPRAPRAGLMRRRISSAPAAIGHRAHARTPIGCG
jgi:hypothetical protein